MFKSVLVLVVGMALASSAPQPARVAPAVFQALQNEATLDVMVSFKAKTTSILNKIQHQSFLSRGKRITSLASQLQLLSVVSQRSVVEFLASYGKTVKSFWISNTLLVKNADLALIQDIAAMDTVDSIVDNKIQVDPLPIGTPVIGRADEVQWGVQMIQAPAAWELGFTGRGVVVANLDSGVRGTHETLRDNYRQVRGWFDTISGSLEPIDTHSHGTHVMGSIVGRNGVGVAPGATWMACRVPGSGYDTYLECGEFFLCPTHANGTEPDCSAAPHIISNSWGKLTNEDFLDATILAWDAAGIIPVWSNGNSGPVCSSPGYPSYTNLPLIAVGASDSRDRLAGFSSRGPGRFGYEERIRPDVTAPGVNIISASHTDDSGLVSMSGTSMASPHVSGVVALLLTNGTQLTYGEVTKLIYKSALHTIPPGNGNCGEIPETQYPNNAVGYGRISALGAVTTLLESRK